MKVYDLVAGQEVELPLTGITSGRYRLTQACLLNGNVKLARGAILWQLGERQVSLTSEERPNVRVPVRFSNASGQSMAHGVVDSSIAAVVESWSVTADSSQLPSPLLPSVLRDRLGLMKPEPELERALATGQWDEISARPRLDMHYVPETLPVARAKRVQASAIEHLSQHSELWARRNISGVVPAKVLARVSEDDHAIYENIVFARLLDCCAHWLNWRIAEVRAIADGQNMAMKLEKGDERHRLLRDRVCALWGEAWVSEAADTKPTSETLERLERMRFHVERLRRTGVYQRVPRSARIPLKLRTTNIFQYDKRYRELQPLWDVFASASSADQIDEVERNRTLAVRHRSFCSYVLLLIRHALRDMGATKIDGTGLLHRVGPWDLRIDTTHDGEIRVTVSACGTLLRSRTFVLLLSKGEELTCTDPNRSLVYAEDSGACTLANEVEQDLSVLNPFRFFSVEYVRHLLDRDLCSIFLTQYPPAAGPVAASVRQRLSAVCSDLFKPVGDRLLVLPSANLPGSEVEKLIVAACAGSPETEDRVRYAVLLGRWLLRCRACGVGARTGEMVADERSLRLVCSTCRLETTVKTSPVRSMTSRFSDERSGFEFCGGVEVRLP